jgi:hypothetical protein
MVNVKSHLRRLSRSKKVKVTHHCKKVSKNTKSVRGHLRKLSKNKSIRIRSHCKKYTKHRQSKH